MTRLRSALPLAAALALLGASSALRAQVADSHLHHQERPEGSPILAYYDFEEATASGPDTFWARHRDGNEITLSDAFRVGGERSLHISEVPGNRDFAEFLAYFDERREGLVFIQFYLLLTDPEQRLNFGLAGERWFLSRAKDGQAVWLQTDDGLFRHYPGDGGPGDGGPGDGGSGGAGPDAGGWREIFSPRPFAWYFIDLVWDVEDGTYDLRIHEEGLEEPITDLRDVRGYNGQPGSAVEYLSLIGDLEDAGRFDFFVDDLMIATHPEARLKPFVAPGRRHYFVESLRIAPVPDLSERPLDDLLGEARSWLDELSSGASATGPEPLALDTLRDRLEAAADAAFAAGRLDFAEEVYERLSDDPRRAVRALLKLSDVAHLRGDAARERALREGVYGRIDIER